MMPYSSGDRGLPQPAPAPPHAAMSWPSAALLFAVDRHRLAEHYPNPTALDPLARGPTSPPPHRTTRLRRNLRRAPCTPLSRRRGMQVLQIPMDFCLAIVHYTMYTRRINLVPSSSCIPGFPQQQEDQAGWKRKFQ
ncbi:Os03g0120800 [Oryza sativa Japonica Group]|uniref:Os03g0120800 protein n=1 Tax=Oryza sativa subsp. japonica TaxID=39947 RepID=A0A0N7KGH4_ORYSJ|nr:hypothetical protein EE612_014983 [Oryza sativa]BAS82025.1 Os03g0120800 [Oryza sativa Japonica Group]